jgi:hypothetical protein
LNTAAEAAIDLERGLKRRPISERSADILVREHIAGTDDHEPQPGDLVRLETIMSIKVGGLRKPAPLTDILI